MRTYPNAFSWVAPRASLSAETMDSRRRHLCQSSAARYELLRNAFRSLQSRLAGRFIRNRPLGSSNSLDIDREHAPLRGATAPQMNRVSPAIYGKINAMKRLWRNSYCHLLHPHCTHFDTAMSALCPQGCKAASIQYPGVEDQISPGSSLERALGDGLNDACERSELLDLRFSTCASRPGHDYSREKAAACRVDDQVQLNAPMHHAHDAHPRLCTRLIGIGCASVSVRSHTAGGTDVLPSKTTTGRFGLERVRELAVDLFYRETHTDIQRLLKRGCIRKVQAFKGRSSLNRYRMDESTRSRGLPRLYGEGDPKQRAIYVFLEYEATAHATHPLWYLRGIVFSQHQPVNTCKAFLKLLRKGELLTLHFRVRGMRPGRSNDLVRHDLPLLQHSQAGACVEVDMPHYPHIVDLDLFKLPARFSVSYKLTGVRVSAYGKRDSSQTHTLFPRDLQAESAPGSGVAQEGSSQILRSPATADWRQP